MEKHRQNASVRSAHGQRLSTPDNKHLPDIEELPIDQEPQGGVGGDGQIGEEDEELPANISTLSIQPSVLLFPAAARPALSPLNPAYVASQVTTPDVGPSSHQSAARGKHSSRRPSDDRWKELGPHQKNSYLRSLQRGSWSCAIEPCKTLLSVTPPAFTPFRKLVSELRLKVWELSLADSEPRIIVLRDRVGPMDRSYSYTRSLVATPLPGILRVNIEARSVALRHYKLYHFDGSRALVNWEKDMIYIAPNMTYRFMRLYTSDQFQHLREHCKNLAIRPVSDNTPGPFSVAKANIFASHFRALKTVTYYVRWKDNEEAEAEHHTTQISFHGSTSPFHPNCGFLTPLRNTLSEIHFGQRDCRCMTDLEKAILDFKELDTNTVEDAKLWILVPRSQGISWTYYWRNEGVYWYYRGNTKVTA